MAQAASAAPTPIISDCDPANSLRGSHSTVSPTTPPRPVDSGQLAGAGSSEAKPAVAAAPTISKQNPPRYAAADGAR